MVTSVHTPTGWWCRRECGSLRLRVSDNAAEAAVALQSIRWLVPSAAATILSAFFPCAVGRKLDRADATRIVRDWHGNIRPWSWDCEPNTYSTRTWIPTRKECCGSMRPTFGQKMWWPRTVMEEEYFEWGHALMAVASAEPSYLCGRRSWRTVRAVGDACGEERRRSSGARHASMPSRLSPIKSTLGGFMTTSR